jgi:general stress protein 26
MKTEIDFEALRSEVIGMLDRHKVLILATSANDRVTARSVSCVHKDLTVFFQTDKSFLKCRQITRNPNVALCADNMQIEGIAKIKGHPLDEANKEFLELFKRDHRGSFERYSRIKNEIVIEVEPRLITLWKYEDARPIRDFLLVQEAKASREFYDTGER